MISGLKPPKNKSQTVTNLRVGLINKSTLSDKKSKVDSNRDEKSKTFDKGATQPVTSHPTIVSHPATSHPTIGSNVTRPQRDISTEKEEKIIYATNNSSRHVNT